MLPCFFQQAKTENRSAISSSLLLLTMFVRTVLACCICLVGGKTSSIWAGTQTARLVIMGQSLKCNCLGVLYDFNGPLDGTTRDIKITAQSCGKCDTDLAGTFTASMKNMTHTVNDGSQTRMGFNLTLTYKKCTDQKCWGQPFADRNLFQIGIGYYDNHTGKVLLGFQTLSSFQGGVLPVSMKDAPSRITLKPAPDEEAQTNASEFQTRLSTPTSCAHTYIINDSDRLSILFVEYARNSSSCSFHFQDCTSSLK